jgi:hypothetical protein
MGLTVWRARFCPWALTIGEPFLRLAGTVGSNKRRVFPSSMGSNAGNCNGLQVQATRFAFEVVKLVYRRFTSTGQPLRNQAARVGPVDRSNSCIADCKDRALGLPLKSFRLLGVEDWSPTVILVAKCRYAMRHTAGIAVLALRHLIS